MNTISARLLRSLMLLTVSLTGCSTPQPVRDVAQRGAATVALAEASLREYISIANAQLSARTDLVRQDSQNINADVARRKLDSLLNQSAGVPADDAIEKKIRELAEQRRKVRAEEAAAREQILAATKLDAVALGQVPADKLADARKRFAVLADELSAQEWITLIAGYAQQIADDIEALKQKEGSP